MDIAEGWDALQKHHNKMEWHENGWREPPKTSKKACAKWCIRMHQAEMWWEQSGRKSHGSPGGQQIEHKPALHPCSVDG